MPQAIVQPEEPIGPHLIESVTRSRECRLAVAYLKSRALDPFFDAAMPLLQSRQLRLSVVFQSADFVTEPDAVTDLMALAAQCPDESVKICWSTDRRFHAKVYGFLPRGSGRPVVFVGSANASKKALGPNSGELCARLSGSEAADAAWNAIDRMLKRSQAVDPLWLVRYGKAYRRHSEIQRSALQVRASWMPKQVTPALHSPSIARPNWASEFSVAHFFGLDREEQVGIKAAITARGPDEPRIPGRYLTWHSNPRGELEPGRPLFSLLWRIEEEPSQGLHRVSVIIPENPIPLASPTTGRTKWWLIPYATVYGTKIAPQARRHQRVKDILRTSTHKKFDWLGGVKETPGKATRELLLAFHVALLKSRRRLEQ